MTDMDIYTEAFYSPKEYRAFIRSIVTMIRRSPEYKRWERYMKMETKVASQCVFTQEVVDEVTVDLHHHPLRMMDIVQTVLEKNFEMYQRVCSYEIAKEVMELHYKGIIGVVPMVRTLHEKFHNGYLVIPLELVIGDWKKFIEVYKPLPEAVEEYLEKQIQNSNLTNDLKWFRDKYPGVDILAVEGSDSQYEEVRQVF